MTTGTTGTPSASTGQPGAGGSPSAAAPAPGSGAGQWFDSFDDADLKGYTQNKAWESPAAAAKAYRDLEKYVGAPADKLMRLPADMGDAKALGDIYNKLGRPAKWEDYKLEVPDGDDGAFAKAFAPVMHEAGLSSRQAEALSKAWNAHHGSAQKAMLEARSAENAQQRDALTAEWGAANEQNLAIARKGAAEYGVDEATIDQLEDVLGYAGVMKLFHKIGSAQGEAAFVAGDQSGGFNGAMTPAGAQARIQSLQGDGDFMKRFLAGDTAAKSEWDRLHQMAYRG